MGKGPSPIDGNMYPMTPKKETETSSKKEPINY